MSQQLVLLLVLLVSSAWLLLFLDVAECQSSSSASSPSSSSSSSSRHQQNQRPSFIERRLRLNNNNINNNNNNNNNKEQESITGPSIRHSRSRARKFGNKQSTAVTSRSPELLLLQPAEYLQLTEWNLTASSSSSSSSRSDDSDEDNEDDKQLLLEDDYYYEQEVTAIDREINANNSYDIDQQSSNKRPAEGDIVTKFLKIIENQHYLGSNCTAGTDLNLGEGVVDQYAQERFRLEANLAVNRANMLTRLWKYAPEVMQASEYLLHASVLSMVEFDEDIFAAGNCYDKLQYRERWLFCPFAHRLQNEDAVLVKDLAVEYKYLSNSSEWFYIARKNAERRIANYNQYQFSRGYHTYTHNESSHTERMEDEILTVRYEDGRWSKPYYDCGGGNIWMLTYTVPFFGYANDTYYFKGTSGIDIDLRRVDIDQCPLPPGSIQLNIFANSSKCKSDTTKCEAIPGLGFRRGSYRCVCQRGYYFPDIKSNKRYYNGTLIEEEYEKYMLGEESQYTLKGAFECLPCAEGCESCEDSSPCIVSLNWVMRTAILILECCIIACLPIVVVFTWKYGNVKVVRAASPVLLRVIVLGAFFIYSTTIVMYPRPNVITCTVRVWLREIGFSLTYGALMLKTWRISVIFRVRSAKAVKITDMMLLKRLGIIVTIFSVFLGIRTLVAPPVVIVARTADDLKAYLCRTDWWDHSFTILEVMFLVWGIRLCIVVRKAPSEFNESRFISMAIYNEFLLSVFLNVSMLFLQSPANPDLLYVIFFCHTQLTVTLLLCLIFGSKAYVVFRGGDKDDPNGKLVGTSKFLKTSRAPATSNQTNSMSLHQANLTEDNDGVMEDFRRLCAQLDLLRDKNARLGNRHMVDKIATMLEAANRVETQVSTLHHIPWPLVDKEKSNNLSNTLTRRKIEALPSAQIERHISVIEATIKINELQEKKKEPVETKCGEKPKQTDETTIKEIVVAAATTTSTTTTTTTATTATTTTTTNTTTTYTTTSTTTTTDDDKKKCDNVDDEKKIETIMAIDVEVVHEKSSTNVVQDDQAAKERNERSKSGHARTHAIVINLDDKSRFSEEVTV